MMNQNIAIIDYGLGNIFSIKHACEYFGMNAIVTSDKREILTADSIILPGVGAFGDAMHSLQKLDLISPLKELAESGKPFIGICLGMQLLFTESDEFGAHKGLDIIKGKVVRFDKSQVPEKNFKVPQVCWNSIYSTIEQEHQTDTNCKPKQWDNTLLEGINYGSYMYFVHSFFGIPDDDSFSLTKTTYEGFNFCSGLKMNNIHAFQFHPERSGKIGLIIYKNLCKLILNEGKNSV